MNLYFPMLNTKTTIRANAFRNLFCFLCIFFQNLLIVSTVFGYV